MNWTEQSPRGSEFRSQTSISKKLFVVKIELLTYFYWFIRISIYDDHQQWNAFILSKLIIRRKLRLDKFLFRMSEFLNIDCLLITTNGCSAHPTKHSVIIRFWLMHYPFSFSFFSRRFSFSHHQPLLDWTRRTTNEGEHQRIITTHQRGSVLTRSVVAAFLVQCNKFRSFGEEIKWN